MSREPMLAEDIHGFRKGDVAVEEFWSGHVGKLNITD